MHRKEGQTPIRGEKNDNRNNITQEDFLQDPDETPKQKLSNIVYDVQYSEECLDIDKQPLHKCIAQHRRATSIGQDSAALYI